MTEKFKQIMSNAAARISRLFGISSDLSAKLEILTLNNGLNVYMVSNSEFTHSKINITVDAGSIYNPVNIPGLAHLVEHMIFQGSEKYPNKNELISFVTKRSGAYNGFTALELVEYVVAIEKNSFAKACDILAHSLGHPLLKAEDCANEISVVDHEFQMNKYDISQHIVALQTLAIDESFPDCIFVTGNKKTLTVPDVHFNIREFHKKHYTANRMNLFIAGPQSMNELKQIAQQFETIPAGDFAIVPSLIHAPVEIKLKPDWAASLIKFHSTINENVLFIRIIIPSTLESYKYRLTDYLVEILAGESRDKFLDNLSLKQLASNMVISPNVFFRSNVIAINFVLDKAGMENPDYILKELQSFFINHIPNEDIFNKIKERATKNFVIPTKVDDVVAKLTNTVTYFKTTDSKQIQTIFEFNREKLIDFMHECADLKHCVAFLMVNDPNLENKESNYEIRYSNPKPFYFVQNTPENE